MRLEGNRVTPEIVGYIVGGIVTVVGVIAGAGKVVPWIRATTGQQAPQPLPPPPPVQQVDQSHLQPRTLDIITEPACRDSRRELSLTFMQANERLDTSLERAKDSLEKTKDSVDDLAKQVIELEANVRLLHVNIENSILKAMGRHERNYHGKGSGRGDA